MFANKTARILFTGYAPVHFVCFLPLFRRLVQLPAVEVSVSGGLRTKTEDGYLYDEDALYRPFDLPVGTVLSVEEIAERDFDILFSSNTRMIQPRSVNKRVQIFHGLSFRNKSICPANLSWDHYFIVGPYMCRRFAESGMLPPGDPRAIEIGFMKTDRLTNGELDRARLLDMWGLTGERPIVLYAPTGAKMNSLEIMGEEVVERLNATGRYDVLVKPHDHPKNTDVDWFERLARLEGDHCRIVREPDVIKLLFLADLLISDASSVANEYAILDRPMIFLDTPELIQSALDAQNSMVDLDTWGRKGGMVVERPEDVAAAVEYSLNNPTERSEVRRAMARDLFYNVGHATDAAVDWLGDSFAEQSTYAEPALA